MRRKMLLLSSLVLLLGLGATFLLPGALATSPDFESSSEMENCDCTNQVRKSKLTSDSSLSPEVEEFIAGSSLSHAANYPDPNEPVEVLKLYLQGIQMLRDGKVNEAVALFKTAVADYPDCRHAHAGLGWALRQKYQGSQIEDDLRAAVQEFILADEIGMKYGRVHYTRAIAEGLGHLQDSTALDSFFRKALEQGNEPYLASLHYAQGLTLLGDDRAETWYKEAMAVEPEGVADAVAYYAEWLLDHGREAEVVALVRDDIRVEYTHFLKGVALEQLGRQEEARREYERYREMSADFPAPARYRIEGSEAQVGTIFEGDIRLRSTESQAREELSKVIAGEANTESLGGKRAVGWTVRTRVFRAYYVDKWCGGYSDYPNTWNAEPPGAPLADKYVAICEPASQFTKDDATPTTNQVAWDVWYGRVPDPVVGACWSGYIVMGGTCDGLCSNQAVNGAFTHGPAWFYNDGSGTPPNYHPSSSCSRYKEETCPNGGSDNWFYEIK